MNNNSINVNLLKTAGKKIGAVLNSPAFQSLIITAVCFALLYRTGMMTLQYDTKMNRLMASGDLIGSPHAHLLFINYVLGLILCFLYKVLPMINWYPVMLLFAIYFSLWAVLYLVLRIMRHSMIVVRVCCAAFTVLLFYFFFMDEIIDIYFMNCAVITGICAFFYLFSTEELKKRDMVVIGTLMILCFGIRFSVFKETLPFLLLAAGVRFFLKKEGRRILFFVGGMAVILLSMRFAQKAAYRTGEYAGLIEVNHARAAIQDYGGLPDYGTHKELYDSLGMEEDDYLVMDACWGLSDFLDKETMSALAEVSRKEFRAERKTPGKIFSYIGERLAASYGKEFFYLEILCAAVLFLVFWLKKDWKMLLVYGMLLGAVFLEFMYLGYIGRMPTRVTTGPLCIMILFSWGYVLGNAGAFGGFLLRKKVAAVLLFSAAVICIFSVYKATRRSYLHYPAIYPFLRERDITLIRHFNKHTEYVYFHHGDYDALELYKPVKTNYAGWSGWVSETPDWRAFLKGEYDTVWDAIAYRRELRFLVPESNIKVMEKYLKDHGYHCHAIHHDIEIDGIECRIWAFVPDEE